MYWVQQKIKRMKKIAIIIVLFYYQISFAQSSDNKIKDPNPLKELGANLIWMTLDPSSVLQHSSVNIIFPTLNEFKLAAQDKTIGEQIRNIFSTVSKDEASYLIPYSVFILQVANAQKKIFGNQNNPSDEQKKLNLLFANLKSGNYTFKANTTFEKNYIDENKLSEKVISCEITIPSLDGNSITLAYVCYKYDSGYKLGLPGKKVNWYFFDLATTVNQVSVNLASKTTNLSIEGEWVNCDAGSEHFTITKQGNVFNLHIKANNRDIVLEKKADGLYTNSGGQVTLKYNDSKKHYLLSAKGDQTVELCNPKEVN